MVRVSRSKTAEFSFTVPASEMALVCWCSAASFSTQVKAKSPVIFSRSQSPASEAWNSSLVTSWSVPALAWPGGQADVDPAQLAVPVQGVDGGGDSLNVLPCGPARWWPGSAAPSPPRAATRRGRRQCPPAHRRTACPPVPGPWRRKWRAGLPRCAGQCCCRGARRTQSRPGAPAPASLRFTLAATAWYSRVRADSVSSCWCSTPAPPPGARGVKAGGGPVMHQPGGVEVVANASASRRSRSASSRLPARMSFSRPSMARPPWLACCSARRQRTPPGRPWPVLRPRFPAAFPPAPRSAPPPWRPAVRPGTAGAARAAERFLAQLCGNGSVLNSCSFWCSSGTGARASRCPRASSSWR